MNVGDVDAELLPVLEVAVEVGVDVVVTVVVVVEPVDVVAVVVVEATVVVVVVVLGATDAALNYKKASQGRQTICVAGDSARADGLDRADVGHNIVRV